MSGNRERSDAFNISSLLEIPLKKRKDSRFHASLSTSHEDDRSQFAKQETKQGDAALMMGLGKAILLENSREKRIGGSSARYDDGSNDDRHINPYLIHQGSNIATQEVEGSHHRASDVTSLIPRQYDWLSLSNLNSTGQDQMAQASFSSPHNKYLNISYDTASSNLLGLSDEEHSEIPVVTSSNMQVRSDEGAHNFASSSIPKGDSHFPAENLSSNFKLAYANLSSSFPKMRPLDMSDGSTRNKADPKCSEIARDRTSSTQVGSVGHNTNILQKPLFRVPSISSISQEDLVPLNYDLSSSSPVIHKKSNLPTSVSDIKSMVPQLKSGEVSSLKSCESQLHPSSKFDNETKFLAKEVRPSLLLKSYKSEPYPGSESDIHTDSFSSMKLHKREPHSKFDFNIHSKDAQLKSGSTSSMNIHEQVICPRQMPGRYKIWKPSIFLSNSPECLKDNEDESDVHFPLKNRMDCSESNISIKDPKMVLTRRNFVLRQTLGRISHSEIGSGSEVDTIHKQKSPCSYNKFKVNLEKRVVKNKSTADQRYQREQVVTKMEQGAVRKKGLYKDNSCVLKDTYNNMSRNISMKCKDIQNNADCSGARNKDESCKSYVKNENISINDPKMVHNRHNFLLRHQTLGRISHSEIGSGSEVDTIHKQKSPCSYYKSKVNLEKRVVKNKPTADQRYQREQVVTKMEQGAVRTKGLYKDNGCVLKDPYNNMSRNISMKCKDIQNNADCSGAGNKDESCKIYVKNENIRNCSDQEVIVSMHLLNGERDNHGTGDQEETILLSDDSSDDISDICMRDGFVEILDSDDDIEIVQCVSKSNRSGDFPTQRKPLDFTKKPMNNNDFKSAVQNMFVHPREDGSVLNFSKSSSNGSADLNEIARRRTDEHLSDMKHIHKHEPIIDLSPNSSTSRTCDDNDIMSLFEAAISVSPFHFDINDPPPPFRHPTHNVYECPKGKVFSPSLGIQYTHWRKRLPEDVYSSSEYPSSSDIPSPSSRDSSSSSSPPNKRDGCSVPSCNITNYLSKPPPAWNSTIPFLEFSDSSTWNFMASSSKSVISEKSAERDNNSDVLEQTPNRSILEIVGASSNVQEDGEKMKTKEILRSSASDSNEEKQQQIAEDKKTEETHKDSRPDWECAICLDTIGSQQEISSTMCGHVYCTPCITEVVSKKKECPTCRKALDATQVHPLFFFR